MKKTESITILIFIAATFLKTIITIPYYGITIIFPLLFLALYYYLLGNHAFIAGEIEVKQDSESKFDHEKFELKVYGITLSILCIGIGFKLLFWPFSYMLLKIGIIASLICIPCMVSRYLKTKKYTFYKNIFLRFIFWGAIATTFYITPRETFREFFQHNIETHDEIEQNTKIKGPTDITVNESYDNINEVKEDTSIQTNQEKF